MAKSKKGAKEGTRSTTFFKAIPRPFLKRLKMREGRGQRCDRGERQERKERRAERGGGKGEEAEGEWGRTHELWWLRRC